MRRAAGRNEAGGFAHAVHDGAHKVVNRFDAGHDIGGGEGLAGKNKAENEGEGDALHDDSSGCATMM